jgi:O-antigen/teichoic acid export membrane protein
MMLKLMAALAGQFGLMLLGIITTILVARVLGPSGKGLFTLALTVASTLVIVTHASIATANAHFTGKFPHDRAALVGNSIFLAIVWGGILTLGCALFLGDLRVSYYPTIDDRLWGMILVALIPLLMLEYMSGLVLGFNAIRRLSMTLLCKELFLLFGIAVLIWISAATPYSAVAVWTLAICAAAAMMLIHALVELGEAPRIDYTVFKRMLSFSLQSHSANLFSTLKLRFDPILLALFLTPADVGYYSIATAVVAGLWYLPAAVGQVVLPYVSGKGDTASKQLTPLVTRISFTIVILIAILLAIFGRWIIVLLPGEAFLPAYIPLVMLLPGAVVYSLAKVLANDLLGRGMPQYGVIISISAFVANVVAAWFLIPQFGMAGAAAATSVTHAFTGLMFLHFFLQESGLQAREVLIPKREDLKIILRRRR